MIECIGGWCGVFDNLIPHADLLSLVSCLAEDIGCVGVLATDMADVFENGAVVQYGKVGVELYGAQKTAFLNHVRSIGVVHAEEGWVFEDYGEPLDFESCFRFNRRRTRDRFTSEMLASYLCHLGIDVGNQGLLTDNGVVFTVHFGQ